MEGMGEAVGCRLKRRLCAKANGEMPSDQRQGGSHTGGIVESPRREGFLRPSATRETQPLSSNTLSSNTDEFLNLSVTEIAIMWLLHQKTLLSRSQQLSASTIVEFYPVALSAISRVEGLRDAKQSDLRLIYFKGLIVAQSHPKWQMIDAIREADRTLDCAKTSNEPFKAAAPQPIPEPPLTDQDTLAHIADALRPPESSH